MVVRHQPNLVGEIPPRGVTSVAGFIVWPRVAAGARAIPPSPVQIALQICLVPTLPDVRPAPPCAAEASPQQTIPANRSLLHATLAAAASLISLRSRNRGRTHGSHRQHRRRAGHLHPHLPGEARLHRHRGTARRQGARRQGRADLRRAEAPGASRRPALGFPPGARRRAVELGGAQGPVARSRRRSTSPSMSRTIRSTTPISRAPSRTASTAPARWRPGTAAPGNRWTIPTRACARASSSSSCTAAA